VIRDLIKSGLEHHHAGRLHEAKTIYEQALKLDSRHPDALHLLGLTLLQSRDAIAATTLLEQATQAQPRNPAFHADLAQAYLASQRAADAHAAFQRAAKLDPRNPQFAVGAAICLALQGAAAEAERQLRKVSRRHPDYPLAWFNLGNVLRDQGRPQEAAEMYRHVIRLDPAFADAYNNLGSVLHKEDRFDDAERAYRRYVALQPDSVAGYFNLASLLIDRGRVVEAVKLCREGIEQFPESARPPELQWMLGSALAHQGKLASALAAFRLATDLAPNNARALWGCGLALLHTGSEQEGLRCLERARELEPGSPEFCNAMAGIYLSVGDLQAGWREYQLRPARAWFLEKFSNIGLASEMPGSLSGKKILLLREQGLGDELFFLRFAAQLKSRGAAVTYRANAKIAFLLERVPALERVITTDVPLPAADLAVLVGDLPRMLGALHSSRYPAPTASRGTPHAATTNEDGYQEPLIESSSRRRGPSNVMPPSDLHPQAGEGDTRLHGNHKTMLDQGFLQRLPRVFYPELPPPLALTPLPERLQQMTGRLSGLGPPPYLGLTWRAGTAPEQQRGSVWMLHKEIPLEQLAAAMRGVNGTLLALQRNPQPGEIESLSARAAMPVHDLTALNDDLEAMLALLALMDDYVGVSNTNMHLRAGASRTARVLLPRPAEWRWMISGNESPWFPGFRVYRQGPDGDWGAAFDRLARDLKARFGAQER
jgi:Flp pilus assembly protein TadD